MTTNPSQSPNRNSLASWWKTFKRKNPGIEEVHDENVMHEAKKEISTNDADTDKQFAQPQQPASQTQPRPILRYKSRSSNYIKPLSSPANFSPSSSESFRAHRDSFLESQKAKNNNDSQVFGVPLEKAIRLASVNISISEDLANEGIQYGAIPVVVGKCCVFLKKNGTEVEGVFRVGGASRRVKELQFLFSTPPDYGRRFDWDGYTVHDAASLLRRFLNSLPEPLIPLALYERFREPLKSRPIVRKFLTRKGVVRKITEEIKIDSPEGVDEKKSEAIDASGNKSTEDPKDVITEQSVEEAEAAEISDTTIGNQVSVIAEEESAANHDEEVVSEEKPAQGTEPLSTGEEKQKKQRKIKKYKKLIGEIHDTLNEYSILLNELPPASQHLLFYILDLLTVFATHSSKNLMSNKNLAAIFQPSILSHPEHDMSPEEYALSAQVVEFLLEYYRRLLEATQKIQSERALEQKQKMQIPSLTITTDNESIKKGTESDGSTNTPITPSSSQLHPPVSKRINRKHSKSLSSANMPPDGLKYVNGKGGEEKVLLQQFNSNTDADDSEIEVEKNQTPTTQEFPVDTDDHLLLAPQKPFSPVRHKKSEDSLNVSNSSGNSSSLFHNFKRPLSVVFNSKDKGISIEDIMAQGEESGSSPGAERKTRWDQSSEHPKKENWFNRLRSRSRSSEPRNPLT